MNQNQRRNTVPRGANDPLPRASGLLSTVTAPWR